VMKRLIETQLRLANHQSAKPDDKHLEEAVKNLDDLLKRHPTDVEGLILRGFAYIQQEKKDAALDSLNTALKLSPNNPDALYYRAEAQTRLGDQDVGTNGIDLAIKDLLAAHDRDSSPNSRLRLAQIYRGTQHYGEAALYYQEVVDLRPDFYSARLEYAQFLFRLAALQKNLPTDSDEAFVRAIRELDPANKLFVLLKDAQQRFPTQPQWFLMYADLEAMRDLDREAQTYYEGLYRTRPGDPEIVDAYVLSLIKTQKYQAAIDLISPLLEVDKNQAFINENPTFVVFYLRRAAAYKGLNKTAEAIADLDRALAFSIDLANKPETNLSPFVIVIDEGASVLTKDVVAARLRDRLAAHPDELVTQIGLLQVLTTLNQPEEAVKLADSIHLPEKNDLLRGQALRQMGLAHYQAKKYEAASKDFIELLKIYPDDVDSLNNYAYMLADGMNKPMEALPHVQHAIHLIQTRSGDDAVKVTATAANLYDTLGYIYLKANKVDDAIVAFRRALNTQPLPPAYLHLATAYVQQKKYVLAQPVAAKGVKMAQLLNDETLPELRKLSNEIDFKLDPLNK
jgi:tetratricopeptide (TPR) repeat protein